MIKEQEQLMAEQVQQEQQQLMRMETPPRSIADATAVAIGDTAINIPPVERADGTVVISNIIPGSS